MLNFLRSPGKVIAAALVAIFLCVSPAGATNTPCSGKKGGIDHCQGSTFVCRDGSVSASKKSCTMETGAVGLLGSPTGDMQPTTSNSCSCRDGSYCTGPRGGRYCITDGGSKSYLRN